MALPPCTMRSSNLNVIRVVFWSTDKSVAPFWWPFIPISQPWWNSWSMWFTDIEVQCFWNFKNWWHPTNTKQHAAKLSKENNWRKTNNNKPCVRANKKLDMIDDSESLENTNFSVFFLQTKRKINCRSYTDQQQTKHPFHIIHFWIARSNNQQ